MQKKRYTALPLVLGLGLMATLPTPAVAADRAEALGSISIKSSVDDLSSPEGFVYTLASVNCPVGARTAATDTSGVAVFDELPVELPDGTVCLYDIDAEERVGYVVNADGAALTGLTAGTISTLPETLELTESAGVLHSPTRNPEVGGNTLAIQCLRGENTAEMRAGRDPFTRSCTLDWAQQSGLGYSAGGALPKPVSIGQSTIGTLTHFNQTIQRGFHNALLDVALVFRDAETGEEVRLSPTFKISIDETNDAVFDPAECKFPEAGDLNGVFACADLVTLSGGDDQRFTLGGLDVDLQARFGVLRADGSCSEPTNSVFTAERTNSTFCILATVTPVYTVLGTTVEVLNKVILTVTPAAPKVTPASSCTVEVAGQTLWEEVSKPDNSFDINYGNLTVDENGVATLTASTSGPNRVFGELKDGWAINKDGSASWTYQLQSVECPVLSVDDSSVPPLDQNLPKTGSPAGVGLVQLGLCLAGLGLFALVMHRVRTKQ